MTAPAADRAGLSWAKHDSLDGLAPALVGLCGGLATSPSWLRHAEGIAARRGAEAGYLTASAGGDIVAVLAYQVAVDAGCVTSSYRWQPAQPGERAGWPRLYLGATTGHLCEAATAPALAGRHLELFGSAAAHLAAARPRVAVAALYAPLPGTAPAPAGVATLRHDAVVDLTGAESFDSYLAGLDRKRRKHARYQARLADDIGGRLCRLDAADVGEAAPLLAANAAKYGRPQPPDALKADLEALAGCFGDQLVAFGYRHTGRLRAVAVGVVHRDTLHLRSFGVDPGYDHRGLYSTVCFHEPVRDATAAGLAAISYGVNAARAKCLRGCWHRRLVGCAFDPTGRPQPLRPLAVPAGEADHVASCTRWA